MNCFSCHSSKVIVFFKKSKYHPSKTGWYLLCKNCNGRFANSGDMIFLKQLFFHGTKSMAGASTYLDTFNLLLKCASLAMEKMPTYAQKKRAQYHDLISQYQYELNLPAQHRDDQKCDDLREKIEQFLIAFEADIDEEMKTMKK